MTIVEIRRARLELLVAEHKTQSALARLLNRDKRQISQWLGKAGAREMENDTARWIESTCEKPHGWMDRPVESGDVWAASTISGHPLKPRGRADEIQIQQLAVRGSMGPGQFPPNHIEVVRGIQVSLPDLRNFVAFSAPGNLSFIEGIGDSMSPTIADGDIVLVDAGVTELKADAIYVLTKGDELFIKRITRHPVKQDVFVMSSDNDKHPSFEIDPARDGFHVHGRVILAWNARRF